MSRISYNTLAKIRPEIVEEIVRFCIDRYGHDNEWVEKVWKRRSFYSIARSYFSEWVNWKSDSEAITENN